MLWPLSIILSLLIDNIKSICSLLGCFSNTDVIFFFWRANLLLWLSIYVFFKYLFASSMVVISNNFSSLMSLSWWVLNDLSTFPLLCGILVVSISIPNNEQAKLNWVKVSFSKVFLTKELYTKIVLLSTTNLFGIPSLSKMSHKTL